jgi:putative DNA primase/helicase
VIDPPQNAGVVETAIEDARPEEERPVEVLLRLTAHARLFRAADGRLHARVPVGDRHEIYGLKTAAFRDWLIGGYYADQGELASDWAIRRVVSVLEARARFDGGMPSFFIRVGRAGSGDGQQDRLSYFLDLGDPSGRAIEISADGWSVVDRPSVQF